MPVDREVNAAFLLECLNAYFGILRSSFDTYEDLKTGRYKSRSTGKAVSKRKVYSTGVKFSRLMSEIKSRALHPDLLNTAIDDYWPDLEMEKCEHPAEWFLGIAMGEIPYQRRSASDECVISQGNKIVDAILTYHQISRDIWFNRITQNHPENWYQNSLFLYANTKAPAEKKEGIREPIMAGVKLFLLAEQGERPQPSRLEIWLVMNPRELFTTDEGRAERDRQEARFRNGEVNFDGESNDHFKQSASI